MLAWESVAQSLFFYVARWAEVVTGHILTLVSTLLVWGLHEWAVHSSNVNSCHGVSLSSVLYMSGQYVTDMFGMHFSTHYTK